ncbi:MAG: DUF4212 domain-containing protein [Nesterenkonia sp.]|uniref:DUF4212 domain-containing protein n=1 Tax=Nesterenkonia marinintestina TaxID=2979865 RepID=UPI0021C16306|nr:DUF4212 domain-containing protein [Nesterenkonia sp. GX14115]MDO5492903.1 DUF4212 domain-containing protein [Nesterenkonia sp.]
MSDRAPEGESHDAPPPAPHGDWRRRYWRKNIRLVLILLAVWFSVSFLAGIVFIEPLNAVVIGGFPLGLWFAQQGSIITFVVLILIYALSMDRLDKEFGVFETPDNTTAAGGDH